MIYNINDHNYISSHHEGKKGYVNKFEKSLKMPFFSVLHGQLPVSKSTGAHEVKINTSDIATSDNIELSSAVAGATQASGSDTGSARNR